ncbi:hypothetical protein ACN27G_34900 [Plantactinospora sp. WMMB334]|uniref:hypothetical protein n=1 Tax=Plantactinospora sp. WMMB334 TaxID=3404119 RepID=UPI003B9238C5
MKTMQWSDAARTPREVAAAVESSGEIRLERRGDGVPFVIMRADRAKQARHGMETTVRLLRNMLAHGGVDLVADALLDAFPWTNFLPEKDRHEFVKEFMWTLEACADLDMWTPFGRMMHEWEQTAAIHADPILAQELSRAVDSDLGPVPAPMLPEDSGAEEE